MLYFVSSKGLVTSETKQLNVAQNLVEFSANFDQSPAGSVTSIKAESYHLAVRTLANTNILHNISLDSLACQTQNNCILNCSLQTPFLMSNCQHPTIEMN
jgi:hypothetical protein